MRKFILIVFSFLFVYQNSFAQMAVPEIEITPVNSTELSASFKCEKSSIENEVKTGLTTNKIIVMLSLCQKGLEDSEALLATAKESHDYSQVATVLGGISLLGVLLATPTMTANSPVSKIISAAGKLSLVLIAVAGAKNAFSEIDINQIEKEIKDLKIQIDILNKNFQSLQQIPNP